MVRSPAPDNIPGMKVIHGFIFLFSLFSMLPLSAQDEPIILEAESGIAGSDFSVFQDAGVTYLTPSTDLAASDNPGNETKIISFSVNFAETGTYDLFARIRVGANNYNDDSFFIGNGFGSRSATTPSDWRMINGIVNTGYSDPSDVVDGGESTGVLTWKWMNVSEYLGGFTFTVEDADSQYTFQYGAREDGLDLDKIAFGKASLYYMVDNLEKGEAGSQANPNDDGTGYPDSSYRVVKTYMNPVLGGDHPDLTLFRHGPDFYVCGSSFHFTPYCEILHSTDLVHWEIISRAVSPQWTGLISDAPADGTWQGAITYFYDSWWIYFSNTAGGGQYYSKADNPEGPWSTPVKVQVTASTGSIGYDNSIFIDDDGTPYMLIKSGPVTNRIQEIGTNGHLVDPVLNLDWVNDDRKYSWAEGPVMCKRDGWYYYFVAGNVYGGQWVLRSQNLTEDSTQWEELGEFFQPITDPLTPFRGPNHITAPVQMDDGTWWVLSHSYENLSGNSWEGKGRQGLLHRVLWDANGKPAGLPPSTIPRTSPGLPRTATSWKLPRSDYFEGETLELCWHFLNRAASGKYSLTGNPGWLSLEPGTGTTHILQKDAGHYYTLLTKVRTDATEVGQQAGIYLTNGNQSVVVKLASGYSGGKKILFTFNNTAYESENTAGEIAWLKLVRNEHYLSGYFSSDGINWTQVGQEINVADLDKAQPDYNSWVGNSNGLFAEGIQADFDLYVYRDGFSEQQAVAFNNAFGVETLTRTIGKVITNSTDSGAWLMIGGLDLGNGIDRYPAGLEVNASSIPGGTLELWLDDIEYGGTKIATIQVSSTGSNDTWNKFTAELSGVSGQHDVYLRITGVRNAFCIHTIRFIPWIDTTGTANKGTLPGKAIRIYPNPSDHQFYFNSREGNLSYRIFNSSGVLVDQGKFGPGRNEFGRYLEPGSYLLEVVSDSRRDVIQLVRHK